MGLLAEFKSSSGDFAGHSLYGVVQFDTSLDTILDDASDNHVGIDVKYVSSVAIIDIVPGRVVILTQNHVHQVVSMHGEELQQGSHYPMATMQRASDQVKISPIVRNRFFGDEVAKKIIGGQTLQFLILI